MVSRDIETRGAGVGPEARSDRGAGPSPEDLRCLAILLSMPEEGALEALREMAEQAPWLKSAVAELEGMPLDRWQAEHTRLFVNGYPKTPCPPFESAYRQGQMGGTMASDLAAFYRRAGLEPEGAAADYLGTLLDCAAYLADLVRSAEPDSGQCLIDALERELWEEHLFRWLPRFAGDLRQASELRLYRVLGERLGAMCEDVDDGA
ncbi:TorD/DmsD family molecular chaperone [Imhoffiella purpurea]|uniref:Cytoplasmic chaperone TorD n=1 Tax=Imhoffiella purpurea TaxID=1249627 RepID=W9VB45_9GAMM|nr:molecular chaperone TorD family protein [Imhoffiella purpurea]EXJ14171.1 Cytoplasmic chaperone TorD [Imhoffiella purpurea]